MTTYKPLKCWEIIECKDMENCKARQYPDIPCWKIDQMYNSGEGVQDVCRECKVYLLHEMPELSNKAGNETSEYRTVMKFVRKCPVYNNNIYHEDEINI